MAGMPVAMDFLVALAEAGGGVLVFAGGFLKDWMTRIGALAIIPVMLGAIFMVHWGQWHFMATETHPMGGMQFQVTLLAILVYLLLKGNGVNEAGSHRRKAHDVDLTNIRNWITAGAQNN
jgi:putative oxidoreductase